MNPSSAVATDKFAAACGSAFWSNARSCANVNFGTGEAVFCKIDEVWRLFRALRRTRKRIVLVTGEGDKPVTEELYGQKPPHVSHWFGTNMFAQPFDTTPIPLGLGAESDSTTLSYDAIQKAAARGIKREKLLYANFGTASNPTLREPLAKWLQQAEQGWVTREPHTSYSGKDAYLESLFSHHFVFCPPGNGEDTHRMWEALYCGAIPVVRESPAMRNFKDLPILFVPEFDKITEKFLRETLIHWSAHNFSKAKLGMEYWRGEFSKARDEANRRGPVTPVEFCRGWAKEVFRICAGK